MGGHPNEIWADEHAAALVEKLANGTSYAQIAIELNEEFGTNFSRNAACGKGFRLQVTAPKKTKATPEKRKHYDRSRYNREYRLSRRISKEEIIIRCAEIEPRHLTLEQLESDDCRYPFGDGPFTFCGRLIMDGKSYCGEHFKLSTAKERTNSEAVTDARARRMRGINFRKALLEGA